MIPEPHRRIVLDLDGVDAYLAPQYAAPEDTPHRGVTPARVIIARRRGTA